MKEGSMTQCLNCGRSFDISSEEDRIASISGSIQGDEYTESWFLCHACDLYTVEVLFEPFLGDDEVKTRGPISREEGDAQVALIRKCPKPWNKRCRCPAHIEYWKGQLD